jgi:hypothetical protein
MATRPPSGPKTPKRTETAAERQARIRDLIAKVRAEAKPAMAKARLKTRIRKLANSRRRR